MKKWFKNLRKKFTFSKNNIISNIETMEENSEERVPWWGNFSIVEEQARYFKIGEIVLCFDRFNYRWHITSFKEQNIPLENLKTSPQKPFKTLNAHASSEITLTPMLPDRSLYCELKNPIYIPMGETLLLYISCPLWIQIAVGNPPLILDEIPTKILADTWYGKNTLEGELCYAANETLSSTRLESLNRDVTSAIIPILIKNQSRETLVFEEVKIPLVLLSIYADDQNYLWTEQLTVNYLEKDYTDTHIERSFPKTLKGVQRLSIARLGAKTGIKNLINSFTWK